MNIVISEEAWEEVRSRYRWWGREQELEILKPERLLNGTGWFERDLLAACRWQVNGFVGKENVDSFYEPLPDPEQEQEAQSICQRLLDANAEFTDVNDLYELRTAVEEHFANWNRYEVIAAKLAE